MLERVLVRWPLKLLALGLAFAIWLSVTGENRTLRDFRVPVDIALGEDFVLSGAPPSTVSVLLRGPESVVRAIDPLDLSFQVDLQDAVPGERSVQLTRDRLHDIPRSVEIDRIEPDRLSLEIDRRLLRALPVVPLILGEPPEGSHFYVAEVFPDRLEVEGPESQVTSLIRLRTEPIRLENRTESFSVRVAAAPDSPEVRVVDTRLLDVRVTIDAAPEEAAIDDVPVVLAGQVYEATVRPSAVRVTLSAPPALLERIRSGQIRAVADIGELEPASSAYAVPLRIDFVGIPAPDLARITVVSVSDREVDVTVSDRRISG